jgi:hypothetical protein
MLAAGLLLCLFGVTVPRLGQQSEAGARVAAVEMAHYIDRRVRAFEAANEEAPDKAEMARETRQRLDAEHGLAALERKAAQAIGASAPSQWSLFLVFFGLASLTLGALFLAYRARGLARVVYGVVLGVGLLAGGVGIAVPDSAASVPTPSLDGLLGAAPGARPAGPAEREITNEELCRHLVEVVKRSLDEVAAEALDRQQVMRECVDSIAKENLDRAKRQCLLDADSIDTFESCLKDD